MVVDCFFVGGCRMVALIVKDFEELVLTHENKLSLKDLVGFSDQLEKSGYVLRVENKINLLNLDFEKPTLFDLIKRVTSTLLLKRLSLTQAQKMIFSELITPRRVKGEPKKEPVTIVIKPCGQVKEYYC